MPDRMAGSRLQRWRKALPARWRGPPEPPERPASPPAPSGLQARLAPIAEEGAATAPAILLVSVLGLSRPALEAVLELVVRETAGTPVRPVFITDSLEFDPFRRRRLAFEYLPDRGTRTRFAPDLDWDLYEQRRYALLREKWRPRSLISFGRSPPAACAALFRSAD